MKALISTVEERYTGYRVAQVEPDDSTFPVADGLFWADCADDVKADYYWYDPADQQIKPNLPPSAEDNKKKATFLLMETDWVTQPDVSDTSINPHLINYQEFISYRAALRAIAINPQNGNLEWPVKPAPNWSSV